MEACANGQVRDLNRLRIPPKERATSSRYKMKRESPLEKKQEASTVPCSHPELYITVNSQSGQSSSQFRIGSLPCLAVVIVPSSPGKLKAETWYIQAPSSLIRIQFQNANVYPVFLPSTAKRCFLTPKTELLKTLSKVDTFENALAWTAKMEFDENKNNNGQVRVCAHTLSYI